MKIAVNTRLLLQNKLEGIGWFTFETLKRLTNWHPEIEFVFLFDRPWHPGFIFSPNITPVVAGPPARHPVLYYLWFEHTVPGLLKKHKADLFLSPDGFLSLNTRIPSISVIHDINFEHRPNDLPFFARTYYRHYFHRFAAKAKRIATVSEYSKTDIASTYRIAPEKIDVVYNGANEIYRPLDEAEQNAVKHMVTGGNEFFLFVGSLHPRKNISGLLRAFEQFKTAASHSRGGRMKLVIVGEKMFLTRDIEQVFSSMQHKEDVIFTGRLQPGQLHKVMGSAYALVFVPFFEGFGIPLLEAMYCDTPVICSDTTSLPEVAGDAALYASPSDIDSIAQAMTKMVYEPELRGELIEKGRTRREFFSWDYTAKALWKCVEKCV